MDGYIFRFGTFLRIFRPMPAPAALALLILALAIIYFAAARLGLAMALSAEQVTLVWPPTGLALAAVILFGPRLWPGILLGAFAANLAAHEPALTALGIAAGNTLEALGGTALLYRFVPAPLNLNRLRDVFFFLLCAAALAPAISASLGVASLCLGGVQPWSSFAPLWFLWWLGDAGGAAIVAPVLLVWAQRNHYYEKSLAALAEALLLAAALAACCLLVFFHAGLETLKYLVFPPLIWAALRFGQRGTTLVVLTITAAAVWATLHGSGPFFPRHGALSDLDLTELSFFMLIVGATGLSLGASVAERREAEIRAQDSALRIQQVFDNALDAIITIDDRGLITEWSAQAEKTFGWARHEAVGENIVTLISPPAQRAAHWQGFGRLLSPEGADILNRRYEVEVRDCAGALFPVELAITSQKIKRQQFFTVFIRDITLEKQTESAKGLLASIVENSGDAIISKDLDGVITSWNAGAERLFGYTAAEAVGRSIALIIPPEKQAEEKEILARLRAGRPTEHLETARMKKNGRLIDVAVTISPIRDLSGRVVGASKVAHDITDRKQAEERLRVARQYLEDLLNHIPDPIFIKDRQHRWIGGNRAFWEMMGGPPEKFIGKSDYEFFPKEEADHFWERDDYVFNTSGPDSSEESLTDPQGRRRVLFTKKISFTDDKGEKFLVGVIRDITQLKKAEEQLLKYTQELERSNQALDDFTYIVSHDLKEPLRGLQGFSHFLLEDYGDRLEGDGKHYLQRLIYLSNRMGRLIEDLLYYSRLGRAELSVQRTDPNAIVAEIGKTLEETLKEKNGRLHIPQPMPELTCDRGGLAEILRNLIANALKYNDKPEKVVEIGLVASLQAPHGLEKNVFYVKDNGIGIPPQFHQTIFQIFRRLQSSAKFDPNGTGAGLTFAKKIVERNKGRIWLESTPGEGSTFYFTLPPATSG